MQTTLAVVSGGEQEANDRLPALREKFADRTFEVRQKDRKHEIVLMNAENLPTPDLETMRGMARGSIGTVEQREDSAKQKETKQAPMPKNPDTGGSTTTGTSGAPAGGAGARPAATPRTAT